MTIQQQPGGGQLGVLIDYENVGLGSIQWLFDEISSLGRIIYRRAYTDWAKAGGQRDRLLELGIEPVQVFQASGSGKNSSDIRLVMDAVELLYQSPYVDTFVIVSADADFVPIVNKLRSAGKTVIGAGRRKAASKMLIKSCDRYYYLDDEAAQAQASRRPLGPPPERSLLRRAVEASMNPDGKALGAPLSQTLTRLDPAFDVRALGYPNFRRYLEASEEVQVSRPKGQPDLVIELSDHQRVANLGSDTASFSARARRIDAAWSNRAGTSGKTMPGTTAANVAAEVLGVPKLSVSEFKTLEKLLESSDILRQRWVRDGNKIIRL